MTKKNKLVVRACKDRTGTFIGFITGKSTYECEKKAYAMGYDTYLQSLYESIHKGVLSGVK